MYSKYSNANSMMTDIIIIAFFLFTIITPTFHFYYTIVYNNFKKTCLSFYQELISTNDRRIIVRKKLGEIIPGDIYDVASRNIKKY